MKKTLTLVAVFLLLGLSVYPAQRTEAATFSLAQASIKSSKTSTPATYTVGPFVSNITVGNEILCVVTSDNAPGQITGLTDNLGNVYTMDFESDSASNVRAVTFWSAPVTVGGADTITVTRNIATSNASAVSCQEWSSGGTGTFAKDITKGATATSASLTTGASSATTHANELVEVGSVTNSTNTTCTVGAGYSNVSFLAISNANVCQESAEVSVTGAQTGTMSWTTSREYAIGLVTYYVVSSSPATTVPVMQVGAPLQLWGPMKI